MKDFSYYLGKDLDIDSYTCSEFESILKQRSDEFKFDIFKLYGIEDNPKREMLFKIAKYYTDTDILLHDGFGLIVDEEYLIGFKTNIEILVDLIK
jgi:hypothetical protein